MRLRSRAATGVLRLMVWLALALAAAPGGAAEDPADQTVIIAHRDVGVDRVNQRELRRMYLGKRAHWHDDQRVVLALHAGDPAAEARLQTIVGKTPKQFASYWRRRVFTGKGRMPKRFTSAAELRAYVGQTPGAIACIGSAADLAADPLVTIITVGEAEEDDETEAEEQ